MLLERPKAVERIEQSFLVHHATAIIGPRQCGKTTLARMIAAQETDHTFLDLEKAVDQRKLEHAEQTLGALTGLVIIDEVQRKPELFETIRVLLDRPGQTTRFLLLGSASPLIVKGISETLAGRIGMIDLSGFDLSEIGTENWQTLWFRGGFPRSFLAQDDEAAIVWRENFIRTFLERDIVQLGINIPAESLRRFWTMIAHYHGQIWNAAEFARSMGTSEGTARRYLDILSGAYMVRVLSPWYENLKKRQVKSPKIYIRDSGILHTLLELNSFATLTGHPKLGASFEGYVIDQLLACTGIKNSSYWATHAGAEIDLLMTINGKRYGFECKYNDAPGTTRSMRTALNDLKLEHIYVIYPGKEKYELDKQISVMPASLLTELGMNF